MPLIESQIENIPVTNISSDSVLGGSGETQDLSVTSMTYGETFGLLDCPVPTPSIDNANSGRSQYASNPSGVKWVVRLSDLNDGKYTYPWREGILVLPDGDIVCTGCDDDDNQVIFRMYSDGTLNWKTIIGSYGTGYVNLAIDANNKIYLGTWEHMACVDAATGNLDWTYVAPAGPPEHSYPDSEVWSGPVIHPLTGDIIFNTWELISLDSNGSRNWGNDNDYYYNEHGIAISPYNNYIYSLTFGESSLGNIYNGPKKSDNQKAEFKIQLNHEKTLYRCL